MVSEDAEKTTLTLSEIRATAALLRALAARVNTECKEDLEGEIPEAVGNRFAWLRKMATKLSHVDSDLEYFYDPIVIRSIEGRCPMLDFTPEEWRRTSAALRVLDHRLGRVRSSPRLKETWRQVHRLAEKSEAIAAWWGGFHSWLDRLAENGEEAEREQELQKAQAAPPLDELVDPEFIRSHPPGHAGKPAADFAEGQEAEHGGGGGHACTEAESDGQSDAAEAQEQ